MKPVLERLVGRRSFFRSAGMAAAGAGALGFATERDAEAALQNVDTRSTPSDLKITDLRTAVIADAPPLDPLTEGGGVACPMSLFPQQTTAPPGDWIAQV